MTLRCFIAAHISDTIRSALAGVQDELQNECRLIRNVPPENLHITLVFLGNVPEENLPGIRDIMDQTASAIPPFSCNVHGIGFFGSRKNPSVIWAGISGNAVPLSEIYSDLSRRLKETVLTPDNRKYSPHVTLARLRSRGNASSLINILEKHSDRNFGPLNILHISLMQSVLHTGRPVYSRLHESRLSA